MGILDSTPPTAESGARPVPVWEGLGFRFYETDWFYRCLGAKEQPWLEDEYRPFGAIDISPSAAVFNYGLGIFEGLKAHRATDGRVLLFRHRDNAKRFCASAERLMLEPFPESRFTEAVEQIVRRNLRFVPPSGKGSFYVRPLEHAIEPRLGLLAPVQFEVLIFGSPVGAYFAREGGLRLKVLEQGRCAAGGTGSAKAIGNYAGSIVNLTRWKQHGFDDVMYLDARHEANLTETSGSNVFVLLKSGTLITPALDDQILPGVTRDSVIRLAREVLGVAVEERTVPFREVLDQAAEVFCTGTAWTVQNIHELEFRERTYRFPAAELQRALLGELRGIQLGSKPDRFGWATEVDGAAL